METLFYHKRPRLTQLFMEAVKYPQVMVCAGAGFGKTSAVHDFLQDYQAETVWVQLSERDNAGTRFWENYTHTMEQINAPFTNAIRKLGFPDSGDKLNQYFALFQNYLGKERYIIVMDDFHLITDPAVIRFIERSAINVPPGTSLFLVSRTVPQINTASLVSRDRIFIINENDLRFTENELFQFFKTQEIILSLNNQREIMEDTEGWAFAINLIARSYQKAPGYGGYLRNAMKTNIFELMETEIWNEISGRLQNFLICLSLIDHLSIDLILILAKGDKDLIAELEKQNAYIHRDTYINAYLIHHLFLEFLHRKQELLSDEQKKEIYALAGDWCNKHGFKTDALAYYEKTGDYQSIVSIFFELPSQVPEDIAQYAAKVFNSIPGELFDKVDLLAVMHIRVFICLGLWQKTFELIEYYEKKYLKRQPDDPLRNHTLGGIYYSWGIMRSLMCTIDDCYDFDLYYAKQDACLSNFPVDPGSLSNHPVGPWISLVGSERKGAPEDYIEALKRSTKYVSHCFNGAMAGLDDLAQGELKFYQGNIRAAETFIAHALEHARDCKQFEAVHRALFYTMRIAVFQGDHPKAERALKDMKAQLDENEYPNRYITFDIANAWYYCLIGLPEKAPDWFKDRFEQYGHAYFIENFGNQAKARYCYVTKNYPFLLTYMQEQKNRESILYGRVEMLAMEACVHYKTKDKNKALDALTEAYKTAFPNDLIMPFIELGKDMRTLTASILKEPECTIPKPWLETMNRKSASYAKHQAHVAAEYRKTNYTENGIALSTREREILTDLSHGLTRTEIAASKNLSVNTVKMVINFIYTKLGAENLADLIRIATERKMI